MSPRDDEAHQRPEVRFPAAHALSALCPALGFILFICFGRGAAHSIFYGALHSLTGDVLGDVATGVWRQTRHRRGACTSCWLRCWCCPRCWLRCWLRIPPVGTCPLTH